jgi:hypothetical protein
MVLIQFLNRKFEGLLKINKYAIHTAMEVNHTYPAGEYYVGDICYALSDDVYQKQWGDKFKYARGTHEITYRGVTDFLSVNATAYGDGTYTDTRNELDFVVDSGTIGIVHISMCEPKNIKDGKIIGGHIIQSITPVKFKSNKGVFEISFNYDIMKILIDTKSIEDEDE